MKMTTENTIVCEFKEKITSKEVDIELIYDVLGKELSDKAYEEDYPIVINKGQTDKHPIKIEDLKNILSELEKSGSNYVSIDYNCDHPDYTFVGANAHIATEEEIAEEIENEKKEKEAYITKRLAELAAEQDKLTKYLKNQE